MREPDAPRDPHIVPAPQIPSSETLEGWNIDGFDHLVRYLQRGQEGFEFINQVKGPSLTLHFQGGRWLLSLATGGLSDRARRRRG